MWSAGQLDARAVGEEWGREQWVGGCGRGRGCGGGAPPLVPAHLCLVACRSFPLLGAHFASVPLCPQVTDGLYGSMNSVLYDHATLSARSAPADEVACSKLSPTYHHASIAACVACTGWFGKQPFLQEALHTSLHPFPTHLTRPHQLSPTPPHLCLLQASAVQRRPRPS